MSIINVTYPRNSAKRANGGEVRLSFTSPDTETNIYPVPVDAKELALSFNPAATVLTVQIHRSNGSDAPKTIAGTKTAVASGDSFTIGIDDRGIPTLTKSIATPTETPKASCCGGGYSSYALMALAVLLVVIAVWWWCKR